MMEKAAPRPVFGALAQFLLHGIAMDVVELLYELLMIKRGIRDGPYPS